MCRSLAWSLGLGILACVVGCRNCDRVESELRARESDVRTLKEENERLELHNQAMQRELLGLKGEAPPILIGSPGCHPLWSQGGHPPAPPPPGGVPTSVVRAPIDPFPIRALVIGRQTAGHPSPTLPGDDGLEVMIEPRDPEGQAVKAPGFLTVEVQEISREGLKRPLSSWDVPPEELRQSWRNGLLNTGYVLTLPWKVWPSTEKLRVTARFRLFDGRTFEADRDITIRVLPGDKRPNRPPLSPAPVPFMPPANGSPVVPQPGRSNPRLPEPLPPRAPEKTTPPVLPPPIPVEQGPSLSRRPVQNAVPAAAVEPAAAILRPVPFGQIKDLVPPP